MALAVAAGLDARLGPFVALYVLVLALASPIMALHAKRLARFLPFVPVAAPPAANEPEEAHLFRATPDEPV